MFTTKSSSSYIGSNAANELIKPSKLQAHGFKNRYDNGLSFSNVANKPVYAPIPGAPGYVGRIDQHASSREPGHESKVDLFNINKQKSGPAQHRFTQHKRFTTYCAVGALIGAGVGAGVGLALFGVGSIPGGVFGGLVGGAIGLGVGLFLNKILHKSIQSKETNMQNAGFSLEESTAEYQKLNDETQALIDKTPLVDDGALYKRFGEINCNQTTALQLSDKVRSDFSIAHKYIHANRIPSVQSGQVIAAQCPGKPVAHDGSVIDTSASKGSNIAFLQAVKENKVSLIVDLTDNKDPIDRRDYYANNKVHTLPTGKTLTVRSSEPVPAQNNHKAYSSLNLKDKQLQLQESNEANPYTLKRLEVKGWEDFQDTSSQDLLQLAQKIKQELSKGEKVLIHCRAGVGRTGTLISLIRAMEIIDAHPEKRSKQDVLDYTREAVAQCRVDRGSNVFVQKEAQFCSLLNAALDYARKA